MKPCSRNRKLISWLALDALDVRKAAALHDHLARCEGCRRYWQEISEVTDRLAVAPPECDLEASERFHRGVAEKLEAAKSGTFFEDLAGALRGSMLNWRAGLTALLVVGIALFVIVGSRNDPAEPTPPPLTAQAGPEADPASDLAPTIANYHRVANQSLEKLSELLTAQGNQGLPPAAVYTISGLERSRSSF